VKADEFKVWLQARRWRGQSLTPKAIQHRRGRLRRVERSLAAMGFPDADVDELISRGKLPALLAKLSSYIGSREARRRSVLSLRRRILTASCATYAMAGYGCRADFR